MSLEGAGEYQPLSGEHEKKAVNPLDGLTAVKESKRQES